MSPKAVIYLRTATGGKTAIDTQRSLCYALANKYRLDVCDEFIDENVSGLHIDRPGIQKLLTAASKKSIKFVIVTDISRLARSMTTITSLKEQLDAAEVEMLTLSNTKDLTPVLTVTR